MSSPTSISSSLWRILDRGKSHAPWDGSQGVSPSRSVSSNTSTPPFYRGLPRIPSSLRLSRKKSRAALQQLDAYFCGSSSSSDAENATPVVPPTPALPTSFTKFATTGRSGRGKIPAFPSEVNSSETEAETTDGEMPVAVAVREGQGYTIGSGPRTPEGERWVGEWKVKDIWSVQSALRRLK